MKSTHAKTGRKSQKEALLCAAILMKCEGFGYITDLHDYLSNNLIIAHYCGFNIMKKLPSYWTFDRFIRNLDNKVLKEIMQSQVLKLCKLGIIDTSFIGLDSTPLPTQSRTIPKVLCQANSAKIITQKQTKIADWGFIPLLIND